FLASHRALCPTLFPYTTLFRSQYGLAAEDEARVAADRAWADGLRRAAALVPANAWGERVLDAFSSHWQALGGELIATQKINQPRSEEHTSELQSRFELVCRLLL